MTTPTEIEARKALLIATSELERVRMALALHDIRNIIHPARGFASRDESRIRASTWLKYAVPLMGVRRMSRIVRYATIAMTVLRVVRAWRRGR